MKQVTGNEKNSIRYPGNRRGSQAVAAACLSFGGVLTFPWMLHGGGDRIAYTNSIFSVFLFFFLFWFLKRIIREEFSGREQRWFWPGCLGTAFSSCMIFGPSLDVKGSISFAEGGMWAGILVWAVIFTLLTRYLWNLAGREWIKKEAMVEESGKSLKNRSSPFFRAGVILLCYVPVFLAVYPGFFVYDAQDEYMQVLTRSFSTHHPLVHVLLLGGMIHLVYKLTGSFNLGIACYTVMQMTAMSFIFAWCVEKLKEKGLKKSGRILLTLYFGLFPVLVMFALCSAKDGFFMGMLLIAVMFLQELCEDAVQFFRKKKSVFMLAASSLLMSLLRHNGFYALLVFALVCIVYLKEYRKQTALCFGGVILAYFLINSALTGIFHAGGRDNQEILTVPISQMARVYGDEKEMLSLEEKEILHKYLPEEALLRYTPKVSDGVKVQFNNAAYEADKGSFLKLWLKWGLRHPFTYINAWFMTSYGFWYPDTIIDVYRGNTVFTYTYGDSSYFGYEVEEPGTRESKLTWLNEVYRRLSLEITQQRIPVISMLFSPGFLFWVTAFILGFLCDKKSWKRAVPFALPMLVWLTVILGPTYLVRYVVFLWALLPVLLWEGVREMIGD